MAPTSLPHSISFRTPCGPQLLLPSPPLPPPQPSFLATPHPPSGQGVAAPALLALHGRSQQSLCGGDSAFAPPRAPPYPLEPQHLSPALSAPSEAARLDSPSSSNRRASASGQAGDDGPSHASPPAKPSPPRRPPTAGDAGYAASLSASHHAPRVSAKLGLLCGAARGRRCEGAAGGRPNAGAPWRK